MQAYSSQNGASGVVGYENMETAIIVEFERGGRYRYDRSRIGRIALAEMKELAEDGASLNTYINQNPWVKLAGVRLN